MRCLRLSSLPAASVCGFGGQRNSRVCRPRSSGSMRPFCARLRFAIFPSVPAKAQDARFRSAAASVVVDLNLAWLDPWRARQPAAIGSCGWSQRQHPHASDDADCCRAGLAPLGPAAAGQFPDKRPQPRCHDRDDGSEIARCFSHGERDRVRPIFRPPDSCHLAAPAADICQPSGRYLVGERSPDDRRHSARPRP